MFSSIKVIALTTENNIFVCHNETVVAARYAFFFYHHSLYLSCLILCLQISLFKMLNKF